MLAALPLQRGELLTGQWAPVEMDAPPLDHARVPPRRVNQASALLLPYVFNEWQEHLNHLQSDGDSCLPVHQADHIAEDSHDCHPHVITIIILQSLHDLWQQTLQSCCLCERHNLIL